MGFWLALLILFTLSIRVGAYNASRLVWNIVLPIYLLSVTFLAQIGIFGLIILWLLVGGVMISLNAEKLRRKYLSTPLFKIVKKILPPLSKTEEEAIAAGTIGWEGELFGGMPDWKKLTAYSSATLSEEEQAFLDNETEALCTLIDPWKIIQENDGAPKEVLDYIRTHGFLGFVIPKEFGGKDFSAYANARVNMKIYSRSLGVAPVVGVPNSIGPGELITKYGTEKQKAHYLPRLANGEEIPCFALTAPLAGSDATSIEDNGYVCEGTYNGKKVIGIKLNFRKRYITLAPIATLIALAFKLYDPDHLMGEQDEYGITCALVPADTKGVDIGRRHNPLFQGFPNGPIIGEDVFIPLDFIIGGTKMAGKGWHMLVECLSAGRAISLPTGAVSGLKSASYSAGLYARIRKQFNIPIGEFEGVQDALARIAGFTLIGDSMLRFTVAAVDRGEMPSVPSAISKYHTTELARMAGNHVMDIHGGKGIMMGPKNYLAHGYMGVPVSITVEGANILTRNMIIFGQGAIRCHPYLLEEMHAINTDDFDRFDTLLNSHIQHTWGNFSRAFMHGVSNGYLVRLPNVFTATRRYQQLVSRFSAALAFVSDIALLHLGGKLKRKESLSARLGDILSMLYLTSTVIKRYHELGRPRALKTAVHWSCQWLLYSAQQALHDFIANYPNRWLAFLMRAVTLPTGRRLELPEDKLTHKLANQLMHDEKLRDLLTEGIFLTDVPNNNFAILKKTIEKLTSTSGLDRRVRQAKKDGKVNGFYFEDTIKAATSEGILDEGEADELLKAHQSMLDVISVDDFDKHETVRQ